MDIDLKDWYTSRQAIDVLSRNSDKKITSDHVRVLANRGKIRRVKLSPQIAYYSREDIDSYIVEDRGVKAARKTRVIYDEKKDRMRMIKKPQRISDMVFDPNALGENIYNIYLECLLSFEGKPILDSPKWNELSEKEQDIYRIMAMGLSRYVSREIHNGKVLMY